VPAAAESPPPDEEPTEARLAAEAARRRRWLQGLQLLRYPAGLLLLGVGLASLLQPPFPPETFFRVRGILEMAIGLVLFLPFQRWGQQTPRLWWRAFGTLVALSFLFTFVRIVGVLYEAKVVEAAGGELGLPAFSGTLIFLTLAQAVLLLFARFPDALD
jgi:hypothetical protein